ncbi:POXA3b laccase small subunit [Roridomyces roridus]|uniref:POXA3b laccase small subunit n=1 Tax=Roridomyces roridus TaxID=1738132 RepID=A0AAD7BEA6_9AGAR|nr:POXA3b laccase small subunit [Roridomyces roridus]
MFVARLFSLALVSVACASTLNVRQTTNTNAAIQTILDPLSITTRNVASTISTLQSNHTLSATTLATQLTALENAFKTATTKLAATATSSGSNTTDPVNNDLGDNFGDSIQLVATSLSGITAQGSVSNFASQMTTLDPITAAAVTQFNKTAPLSFNIVHILMLDAQQFLTAEGLTATRTALGFT